MIRRLILYPIVLERDHTQPQIFCLPDDYIFDGFELFLLGERQALTGRVLVVTLHLISQVVPYLIALSDSRNPRQLIHDGVHLLFERFL